MMKHESVMTSAAIPIDITSASKRRSNNDMIRCINDVWRSKNVTTTVTPSTPKSPITKAFDFLPWSRSRKQTPTVVVGKHDDKKDPTHYQKNIFRNGGGIIRDILSDKLNKDRIRDSSLSRSDMKRVQKKAKQISRNKSLDINELIDSVENKSTAGKTALDVRNRFMDDTFIENINRAKSEDDGRVTEKLANGYNPNGKHILFNDENVVYLIKNEIPVAKRQGRSSSRQDENYRSLSRTRGNSSPRLSGCEGGNVVKARLKFKKISPERSSLVLLPASGKTIMKSGSVNAPPASPSSLSTSSLSSASTAVATDGGAGNKRGILQRQDTCPSLTSNLAVSSALGISETNKSEIRRRKSFNDTNFENQNNSSSGSIGCINGAMTDERPKSDKPRKKLSFREPIVSPRCVVKSSRQSSPHQFHNCEDKSSRMFDNKHAANSTSNNGGCAGGGSGSGNGFIDPAADSQAMRIVRTVGQAFEVCHKFNLHKNSLDHNEERSDASSDLLDVEHTSEQLSDEELSKKDQITVSPDISPPQRPNHLDLTPQLSNNNNRKSPCVLTDEEKSPSSPISPSREINKLKDQLEQQAIQTRQALAQLMLVREQLISETNARIEAQARTQQLLQQNRELLEHLASLGAYTDPQATTGLTSANIALAPQSQLQMLFQDPTDLSAAMRKAILASTNNNNLATINQQINNLGSINQQLTTLSHQLSGLNQQSQNLQNFQNLSATLQQQQQQQHQSLTPPQQQQMHQSPLHLSTPPVSQSSSSPIPSMSQLQTLSNQFTNISSQGNQDLLSKELFQMNQELLNRLQSLNLNAGNSGNNPGNLNGAGALGNSNSPHNSFFYVNPMSCSPNNNSSFNFLSSPSSLGNLTPSPIGTLNRNSYSNSPIHDDLGLSIDKNLNSLEDNNQHYLKQLPGSSIGAASNGNLTGASGSGNGNGGHDNSRSSTEASTSSSPNRTNEQRFNTVMLKVTDESGNVTNQRKLSATPSFITRSTSEKVPNRSQIMSQVQRTTWARHTTK